MGIEVSIVLPKFNSRQLAVDNIRLLHAHLSGWCRSFEIIVVDDGSRPEDRLQARDVPASVRLIQLEKNSGKGAAVRRGMLEAAGEFRFFTDIDLPYDLSAIDYAYSLMKHKGFPFVAGDRTLRSSEYSVEAPLARRLASKVFAKMVTLLIIGGIYDSQCGFKAFTAPLAKALFPLLTIGRFSFDVEIYYLILKYNIVIRRIPVCLRNHEVTTVSLLRYALPMACQIMSIPFKWYAGRYHSDAMWALGDGPYWKNKRPLA